MIQTSQRSELNAMVLDHDTFELLKESVRRFVRERLMPAEDLVEENDEVPPELLQEMKDLGLCGLSIPEEYGGIGLSMAQECGVAYELGQTALAFRSAVGTNIGIGSQGILMDGTAAQKAEYLPRIASGELIMSFALTEPDAGSDAASLKTRAVADGEHDDVRAPQVARREHFARADARQSGRGARGIAADEAEPLHARMAGEAARQRLADAARSDDGEAERHRRSLCAAAPPTRAMRPQHGQCAPPAIISPGPAPSRRRRSRSSCRRSSSSMYSASSVSLRSSRSSKLFGRYAEPARCAASTSSE